MPSKYPVLPTEEVIRRLRTFGFAVVSQKGSHRKYSDGKHTCIVPMHDEVRKGTLQSILEQAIVSLEAFMRAGK
ncbi:MAG: type II toxin-antitoxin system HicA family toxin [Oscillospiraceae bacterium]|jgi:predicted RNA binding protein YcfA (HicA-like mRNA interferase family)|nr:type II toxin-antitoxin system HicA family toxin [Oscillospiraceae bacterium]